MDDQMPVGPYEDLTNDDDETCDGYSPDTWCGICKACREAQEEERALYGHDD